MIADTIFFAIAGFDFYHAVARILISRGLGAGRIAYGWTRRSIDAAVRRRRIDQEDLKVPGDLGRGDILLKCAMTPS
ncbi:hypothetical protein [Bradyrhizobium sp. 930_D9_N1_4]|uniref:hypothetical protein n=1 Tax=Bradyrhizobium sp. 930_D9_N1_4 TaxID=3240374 RepID=UPI003F8AC796